MRVDGFYWVFFDGQWMPAEYECGNWWIPGSDLMFSASDFPSIGDRVSVPNEYRND